VPVESKSDTSTFGIFLTRLLPDTVQFVRIERPQLLTPHITPTLHPIFGAFIGCASTKEDNVLVFVEPILGTSPEMIQLIYSSLAKLRKCMRIHANPMPYLQPAYSTRDLEYSCGFSSSPSTLLVSLFGQVWPHLNGNSRFQTASNAVKRSRLSSKPRPLNGDETIPTEFQMRTLACRVAIGWISAPYRSRGAPCPFLRRFPRRG